MYQLDLLKGKVALITGGGTGICRGIALAFAAHGCDVAITSRRIEHLEPTAVELRALGRRAVAKANATTSPSASWRKRWRSPVNSSIVRASLWFIASI